MFTRHPQLLLESVGAVARTAHAQDGVSPYFLTKPGSAAACHLATAALGQRQPNHHEPWTTSLKSSPVASNWYFPMARVPAY
jgi:hypothetical protein